MLRHLGRIVSQGVTEIAQNGTLQIFKINRSCTRIVRRSGFKRLPAELKLYLPNTVIFSNWVLEFIVRAASPDMLRLL
jgi:hypothetical protein